MELVIIHGAPGVGKLTVAEALAARTGFRLFHNHLTTDLVTSLFPFGSEQTIPLIMRLRIALLAAAAEAGLNVIHTFVYAVGPDDGFMQDLIDTYESRGGHVTLVLLTCDEGELLRRVTGESRARFGKLRNVDTVRAQLAEERLMEPFPHRPSLVIDNTHRDAADVAAEIAAALNAGW